MCYVISIMYNKTQLTLIFLKRYHYHMWCVMCDQWGMCDLFLLTCNVCHYDWVVISWPPSFPKGLYGLVDMRQVMCIMYCGCCVMCNVKCDVWAVKLDNGGIAQSWAEYNFIFSDMFRMIRVLKYISALWPFFLGGGPVCFYISTYQK